MTAPNLTQPNEPMPILPQIHHGNGTVTISTQDLHRIEELRSLLKGAVGLIEDLSEGLEDMDLEDDVTEFLAQYRAFEFLAQSRP